MTESEGNRRSDIAGRLREARKLAGLSQGHVAQMLGLHRPSVTEIESGNRRISTDEIVKLAELYDVSVAWLVGDAPDKVDQSDPRLELAARELTKLRGADLDRLLKLLAAMRTDKSEPADGGDR